MFNVGDVVWVARYGMHEKWITCPICFGKKRVTLILGNEDHVSLPCSYCAPGYEPPQGMVKEYSTEKQVGATVITGRDIRENNGTAEVSYHTHEGYCHGPDIVFATEAEAVVKADALCAEETRRRETLAVYLKEKEQKSFSWNAGYHLRTAKKMRADILYHERMAVLCKQRSKEDDHND
jgi:hypothetical protein